jgi:hypothetical protein
LVLNTQKTEKLTSYCEVTKYIKFQNTSSSSWIRRPTIAIITVHAPNVIYQIQLQLATCFCIFYFLVCLNKVSYLYDIPALVYGRVHYSGPLMVLDNRKINSTLIFNNKVMKDNASSHDGIELGWAPYVRNRTLTLIEREDDTSS